VRALFEKIVTNRQTDGRTDGQTDNLPWHNRAPRSIAL